MSLPTFADVRAASERLVGVANRTPVLTSRTADERVGASLFLKCENFQRAGAFKFRGAYNALSLLSGPHPPAPSPPEVRGGVLTFSSGNHAQALALAGRLLAVSVTIVMPSDAPAVKVEATRGYGGEVVFYERAELKREELGRQLSEELGLEIVHPYDNAHIVAGAGTAAMELFEEAGPLDLLLVPCGGGGLLSGSALSADALSPGCQVIAVEPEAGDDGKRSFESGTLQTVDNPDTIADGARTPWLGPKVTFPLIQRYVQRFVTVSDAEIVEAMRFVWERMKIVVEPTGCLAVAAALSGRVDVAGKRVGIMVSGGNVDLGKALGLMQTATLPIGEGR